MLSLFTAPPFAPLPFPGAPDPSSLSGRTAKTDPGGAAAVHTNESHQTSRQTSRDENMTLHAP